MLKLIFLLLVLSFLSLVAQGNITGVDSLRIEQKYEVLLSNNLELNMPLYSLNNIIDPYSSPFEMEFLNPSSGNLYELNAEAMSQIKSDMSSTFAIYRKGQNKYHLGVVSDILGYVSTAAAAGLAAYHVIKYKKKYGIK